MEIFGWIMLFALAIFGLGILVAFAIPFVIIEIKAISYKIKKGIEDRKLDVDNRSEARQHRDEIKRQKDFELANKKLDAKLIKLDKQIKLLDEKQSIAKELKKSATADKAELIKTRPAKIADKRSAKIEVKAEEPVIADIIDEVAIAEEPEQLEISDTILDKE